jgi:hypothetical protein
MDEGNYRTFVAAGKTQVYIASGPRVKGTGLACFRAKVFASHARLPLSEISKPGSLIPVSWSSG